MVLWLIHHRRRLARWLILAAVVVFAANWVRVIKRPMGDFARHWRFGDRFLHGAFLYEGGLHSPYPPFWAMASSALTVGPYPLVRAVLYPFGLVPLAILLTVLHRCTARRLPLVGEPRFWATTLALVLASRFLIRELPECGTNLAIVALAWVGLWLWMRRREGAGALALGLSIALKCTPALFLAYLSWKRQWRMVALTVVAALAFTVAPTLRMGPRSYADHCGAWLGRICRGVTEPNPLYGVLNDEKLGNISLRPALGRLLTAAAPGHASHLDHPLRLPSLGLDPVSAGVIARALTIGLLVSFAAAIGRRIDRDDELTIAWECAAVSLLMLLVSPITWRQHCVAALPATYLIARTFIATGPPRLWMRHLLALYVVLVLILDRGLIGKELTEVLDGYGATTWALVGLVLVTLGNVRARRYLAPAAAVLPIRTWMDTPSVQASGRGTSTVYPLIRSNLAPRSDPSLNSPSARFASSRANSSTSGLRDLAAASSRNSRTSRRVTFATLLISFSRHKSAG
jgi:alpha-1,2-mannosyltransferase